MNHLHQQQVTFKLRVCALREARRREAAERAHVAAVEWKARLERIRRDRQVYLDHVCPLCGQFRTKSCCRSMVRTHAGLRRLLRQMAGIAPEPPQVTRRTEWSDWNLGAEGPRKCGPALWDNTVRAWEEDR